LDLCDARWRAVECSKKWLDGRKRPSNKIRQARWNASATGSGERDRTVVRIAELRGFLANLTEEHFVLVVAWLMSCLRDTGTFPI